MKGSRTAWAVAVTLVIAWVVLGFAFDTSPDLGWLPKWAVGAAVLAPAAWIAVYTVQGLAGAGKWWRSDVGTNMVWLELAAIGGNAYIAWGQFFNHGLLDTPAEGWGYIGCLLAGALIITWRSVIWLRGFHREPPLLTRIRELEAENAGLRQELERLA